MLDPNSNIPEISKMFSLNELKTTAVCSEGIESIACRMYIVREIVMKGKGMEEGWQLFSSLSLVLGKYLPF